VKKKIRLLSLFIATAGAACAADPLPLLDADPIQCFGIGLSMQLTFEMTGLVVRFVRNLRASGNVDVGG
jgi:hypothetical protein